MQFLPLLEKVNKMVASILSNVFCTKIRIKKTYHHLLVYKAFMVGCKWVIFWEATKNTFFIKQE